MSEEPPKALGLLTQKQLQQLLLSLPLSSPPIPIPSVNCGIPYSPLTVSAGTTGRRIGGGFGMFDVPCPECSVWPGRSAAGRCRKVLRVWRKGPAFITYYCVRCGAKGHTRADDLQPVRLTWHLRCRPEPQRRESEHRRRQNDKASWLWRRSIPLQNTIAEQYLRSRRRIGIDRFPSTLRYLPPTKPGHRPAMIAAFGMPREPTCGTLAIDMTAVRAVHLTFLKQDGSDKAGTDKDKITIGSAPGAPIVLAPPNNLLGLAITEGIEDALTVHEATGLGAWAAGAALRMPTLAAAIPAYSDWITIVEDDDEAGRRGACALAKRLRARGFNVAIISSSPKQQRED